MKKMDKYVNEMLDLFEKHGLDRTLPPNKLRMNLKKYLFILSPDLPEKEFIEKLGMGIFYNGNSDFLKVENTEKLIEQMEIFQDWQYPSESLKSFLRPSFDEEKLEFHLDGELLIFRMESRSAAFEKNTLTEEEIKEVEMFVRKSELKRFRFKREFHSKAAFEEVAEAFKKDTYDILERFDNHFPLTGLSEEFRRIAKEMYVCRQMVV